MQMSTTLLASGLVDKVEEQQIKLENLMCHFAKLGGHNYCQGLRFKHL